MPRLGKKVSFVDTASMEVDVRIAADEGVSELDFVSVHDDEVFLALDRELAEELAEVLAHFAKTGELP